jgi:hypothetical protein
LKSLTDALGVTGAACIIFNRRTGNVDWVCFSGLSAEFQSAYINHYAPLDPFGGPRDLGRVIEQHALCQRAPVIREMPRKIPQRSGELWCHCYWPRRDRLDDYGGHHDQFGLRAQIEMRAVVMQRHLAFIASSGRLPLPHAQVRAESGSIAVGGNVIGSQCARTCPARARLE